MAVHKIRALDESSAGITIPRGHLEMEGILDPDTGELDEEHVLINRVEEGRWEIERVDLDG